jgi:hypothetical protein
MVWRIDAQGNVERFADATGDHDSMPVLLAGRR